MINLEDLPVIQLRTLLPIIRGDDVIARVQSSTDRIVTLSIAVLQKLDVKIMSCQALIAVPTAELAQQAVDIITTLGDYLRVQCYACVDATDINEDIAKIQEGVHVAVGTPGRMYDLVNRRALRMHDIRIFCLDDANEMLSRGFEGQVYEGTWKVFYRIPRGTQVILLSASMSDDTMEIAKKFMREPIRTLVKHAEPTPRPSVVNRPTATREAAPDRDQLQVVDKLSGRGMTRNYFKIMGLNEALLRGISSSGMKQPSHIQERAIVPIVKGHNVIIQAERRAGKTIALCIAILQKLDLSVQGCQALMLVPHAELALEVQKYMISLGDNMNVVCHACVDGTSAELQGVFHVVAGIPSRVHDMINAGTLETHNIKLICIDDAEETGLKGPIYEVLQRFSQDVQVALTYNTMPTNVSEFAERFMREPVQVLAKRNELEFQGIKQFYAVTENEDFKLKMLCDLLNIRTITHAVIFCNTRIKANWLTERTHPHGFTMSTLHRKTKPKRRENLMKEIRSSLTHHLVISDSYTRAIHNLPQVRLVINYELPTDCELYHRRTGCGGLFGRTDIVVINLVTTSEVDMLRKIEQLYDIQIKETHSHVAALSVRKGT